MKSNKPNLFVVGAAKSATTSLHYYLSQHPDICMSDVKEPHYFSKTKRKYNAAQGRIKEGEFYHTMLVKDIDTYLSIFKCGNDRTYWGEASPSYLFDSSAAKKIFDFNPQSKIIIMLREPVNRAYSHYQMVYNIGFENEKNFLTAINKDQLDTDKMWGGAHLYIELGKYFEQIKRYSDIFPRNQILVLKFEEFVTNPIKYTKKIFEFLDIDADKVENLKLEAKNTTNTTVSPLVNSLLYNIKKNSILRKLEAMTPLKLKETIKSFIYTNKKKKANTNDEKLSNADRDYLNKRFFDTDKELLKKEYGIFWD